MINYQEIKEHLKGLEDYVFYIPLKEEEVAVLEQKVGIDFPAYYREFLLNFGMQQDFVPGLFTNAEDFVEQNEYLQEAVPNYLMIGDNGGEDYWILRTEKVKSQRVFNWIDGEIEKTDFTFEELIEDSLDHLEDLEIDILTNSEKSWCVQFAITTADEEELYKVLPLQLKGKWVLADKSEAGVTEYVVDATLNKEPVQMSRLHYGEGSTPTYFIDYKESLDSVKKHGMFKQWAKALEEKFPEFNLVDYGILPTDFEME